MKNQPPTICSQGTIYTVAKRGNECYDNYTTRAITPFVKPTSQDYFLLDFEIKHTKKDKSDFSGFFSLAGEIAELASQNTTDGLVSDLTKISTSGLNTKLQQFLSSFRDDSSTIAGSVELTLSQNTRGINHDRYIFSIVEPQGVGANVTYDLEKTNVSPIALEVSFAPSIFAGCPTYEMKQEKPEDPNVPISCSFDSVDDVVKKKLNGQSLITITEQSEGIARRLIDASKLAAEGRDVKRTIQDICLDMKTAERYSPHADLNTVDSAILRLAILTKYIDYRQNPDVRHLQCLNNKEQRILSGLSPSLYGLIGDRPSEEIVERRARELIRSLRLRAKDRNKVLFADDGQVEVNLDYLLEAGLPRYKEMPDGADVLTKFDYIGAPWCAEYARPKDGARALTPFGFYQSILIDGTSKAAAFFVDYDEETGTLIRDLAITTPDDMYKRLGRDGTATGSILTGPNSACATNGQKSQFRTMMNLPEAAG